MMFMRYFKCIIAKDSIYLYVACPHSYYFLATSLAKEVMFLVALVCLSVLSICKQHYSKSYKWIAKKFYRGARGYTGKN